MSIRETVERCLSRVEAGDPAVFTGLYRDAALAAADASDGRRKAGVSLGPLDGVVVSIKDLFDVAGEPTTAGSDLLRKAAPAAVDAAVVARLRRAGAVIIGKTNMSEFAFSGLGLNPHFGTPGNAADRSRVPGGSSSGAGVSAALGTSEIAIGTDTGGSVRIPAALNGVVGFKPTTGRIPLTGAFPLSYTLDSIGPLARTVAGCAAADAVMAGLEPQPLRPHPLTGLRIGVPRGRLFAELEPLVADAFERALGRLSAAGSTVTDYPIETLLDAMAETTASVPLANIEAAAVHADRLGARAAIDPNVYRRIAMGQDVPATTFIRMMRRRSELIDACDQHLMPVDILALPTTATTAPLIEPLAGDPEAFSRANALMLRNTLWGNFFDLTAISLPMPDLARPAGLMLVARRGTDGRLLDIAAAVETAI